jgi:hypothetical protein
MEQLQVFTTEDHRSFVETARHRRDAFADRLTRAIHAKLLRLYPAPGGGAR